MTLALAVTVSSLCLVTSFYLTNLLPGMPRSVLVLEWAAAVFSAGLIPFVLRLVPRGARTRGRRTIVVGAGERAGQLLRDGSLTVGRQLDVVGIVDLDGARQGQKICGVQVCGTVGDLPAVASRLHAEFAVIALEPESSAEMRRVVERCIAAELQFQTLGSPDELPDGSPVTNELRNVRFEDVLERPTVHFDPSPLQADLQNRVILLTGAAGSIGSELARQIAPFGPARLILLDQAESGLHFLHLGLSRIHPEVELVPIVCDITNQSRLAQVYSQYRPDYVIHAAAYKHVPLMESNPFEAVRNNVLGTLLVATNAVRYGASKLLLVSTDKAIRPSSVMGATKRVAERIIFGLPNLHRSGTDFRAVRFGNVLSSSGSVIPLFERQLAGGGPITVSHPEARRYFMTIPEAARLVLQAGSLGETAGAIAMLDMGKPVRILDLAEKLVHFSGLVPGRDIQILITGLRAGEKLNEEQSSALEPAIPTSVQTIRISQAPEDASPELVEQLSRLLAFLESGDHAGLLTTLCELVPECVAPLRKSSIERVSIPVRNAQSWDAVVHPLELSWRERRRAALRVPEPPDLSLNDRRNGSACRRKTPRMGGRRRTDVGTPLATVTSPTQPA